MKYRFRAAAITGLLILSSLVVAGPPPVYGAAIACQGQQGDWPGQREGTQKSGASTFVVGAKAVINSNNGSCTGSISKNYTYSITYVSLNLRSATDSDSVALGVGRYYCPSGTGVDCGSGTEGTYILYRAVGCGSSYAWWRKADSASPLTNYTISVENKSDRFTLTWGSFSRDILHTDAAVSCWYSGQLNANYVTTRGDVGDSAGSSMHPSTESSIQYATTLGSWVNISNPPSCVYAEGSSGTNPQTCTGSSGPKITVYD
jgi:hypothetical protein